MQRLLLLCVLCLASANPFANELLDGWSGYDNSNRQTVNHQPWQSFLDTYLKTDDFGQTYFAYQRVTPSDLASLTGYISSLEAIDPLVLSADVQKAYWFNLYNAATVQTVLDAYPVDSIRDIGARFGGLLKTGPWKEPVVTVNGQALSLDDIEHGIVRPKYQDHRVHYAFNCAAMGCPNLSATAYTGQNIESLLAEAESTFVNHQRGVRFQGGTLILSKIYDWYRDDFVESESELPGFLAQFAEPKLRAQLNGYRGNIRYEYDWSLNEEPGVR